MAKKTPLRILSGSGETASRALCVEVFDRERHPLIDPFDVALESRGVFTVALALGEEEGEFGAFQIIDFPL